jgi:2-aminoethylphosphonate-pyruvate transaminase
MTTSKLLFTPGPLTTSPTVKAAMMCDAGSRDLDFLKIVREIRQRLLKISGAATSSKIGDEYECVLMQGSGTFAIESVISSAVRRDGKLLVLVNGAYGRRITEIARIHGIETETMDAPEDARISPDAVAERLAASHGFGHVAVIHCETTTGIVNPIEDIGAVVERAGAAYIVDAMSSFGAIPLDLAASQVDFLISSANKCIEGVPGFGFVLARRGRLLAAKGQARTLSLDLHAQWAGLERNGEFRFTPPTHALLAFHQALMELEAEGGVAGRATRYRANHTVLMRGMEEMGFRTYLAPEDQSYIISTFRYPEHSQFCFEEFYGRLSELGFIIYPGKLTAEPCFRIGTIGRLSPPDIEALLAAMRRILGEMGVVPDRAAH